MIKTEIYNRNPINTIDGLPIFSSKDGYIKNYDVISKDHLALIEKEGKHFISEDLWKQCEASTSSLIQKYAKTGDRILDVGVGLGRLLSPFKNLERFGVDISLEYLKIAKTKNITCSLSKVEELPYKDKLFDIIVCTDVLEHVLDFNKSISEILRVLKPNGYLIIRVPYREDLSPYLAKSYPYFFVHLRSFDEFSLELFFSRIANCKTIEWNTAGDSIQYSRFKYPSSWMIINKLRRRIFNFLHKNFKSNYVNKMLHKVEINYVVKK